MPHIHNLSQQTDTNADQRFVFLRQFCKYLVVLPQVTCDDALMVDPGWRCPTGDAGDE